MDVLRSFATRLSALEREVFRSRTVKTDWPGAFIGIVTNNQTFTTANQVVEFGNISNQTDGLVSYSAGTFTLEGEYDYWYIANVGLGFGASGSDAYATLGWVPSNNSNAGQVAADISARGIPQYSGVSIGMTNAAPFTVTIELRTIEVFDVSVTVIAGATSALIVPFTPRSS